MTWTWWTLTLMPYEGWIVTRFEKHNQQFARPVEVYDRLTRAEAMQVLDDESTRLMLVWSQAGAEGPSSTSRSSE